MYLGSKIRNTSEAVIRPQYPLGHHTDGGPMGLGQCNSLGEYCGPHTASSVFPVSKFDTATQSFLKIDM